jgi:hypothetical protein
MRLEALPTVEATRPGGPTPPAPRAGVRPDPPARLIDPRLKTGLVRLTIFLLCVVCVSLAYGSFFRRWQPLNQRFLARLTEMNRLSDEVEQLSRQTDEKANEQIKAQYPAALAQLINGPDELLAWQEEVKHHAEALALKVTGQAGPPQTEWRNGQKLAFVPLDLRLEPQAPTQFTNSPYERLIYFAQALAHSPKRFQLVEFAIEGDAKSLQRAQAVLRFWIAGGPAS